MRVRQILHWQTLSSQGGMGSYTGGSKKSPSCPRCVDCSSGQVRLLQRRTLPSLKKVFAAKPDGTGIDSFGAFASAAAQRHTVLMPLYGFLLVTLMGEKA
jgi:hypothetical protein